MAPKPKTDDPPKKPRGWSIAEFKFKPGQSGNPGGRPKKKPITERYQADLELPAPDKVCDRLGLPRNSTLGDCAARATLLRAIIGKDVAHVKEIRESIEGKAAQSVSVNLHVTDKLAERLAAARKKVGKR